MNRTNVVVKITKLHKDAKIPHYATPGAAAMDLTAVGKEIEGFVDNVFLEYRTGIAVEIPEGVVGLLFPRSSISNKKLSLANCVGVIDSDYRGEIKLRMRPIDARTSLIDKNSTYEIGDRVGQIMFIELPKVNILEVTRKELTETERGEGGFGHTG